MLYLSESDDGETMVERMYLPASRRYSFLRNLSTDCGYGHGFSSWLGPAIPSRVPPKQRFTIAVTQQDKFNRQARPTALSESLV